MGITFAEWEADEDRAKEMAECKRIAQQRTDPETFNAAGLLEELQDISGVACRLLGEAKEYHQAVVLKFLGDRSITQVKKTELDLANKWPCKELLMRWRLQDLNDLINLRISACQSLIKAYQK